MATRRTSRDDKRRRIIDAAVEVFAEKGFFGAKVSEVAKRADVADGTIYLYFKSKDDILISLFEEKMEGIIGRLTEILDQVEDPRQKMRRYIMEHLELVSQQPHLMQVLTVELRQSARFIKEYRPQGFKKYLEVIGAILEEGQAKGVFRKDLHPGVFRRALFGAIDEISLEWVLHAQAHPDEGPPSHLDPKMVAEQIAEFILRGLAAT